MDLGFTSKREISESGPKNSSRRRFLKTSATLAVAAGMGGRPSRGGELGVDAGLFATDNEKIREARRVALAILKPSERDLERGLELHADALVFESYGFAPRAAIDGEAFNKAAEEGASDRRADRPAGGDDRCRVARPTRPSVASSSRRSGPRA